MRLILASLAVLVLLAAGWILGRSAPLGSSDVAPANVTPVAAHSGPDAALAEVVEAPVGNSTAAVRESAEQIEEFTVERPPGFSELVLRVREAGKPLQGVLVQVADGVDALLNGLTDQDGFGVTDSRGEVAYYVRPTRTARVKVVNPETGWTAEGLYTTPFEGRRRVVVLDLSPGSQSGRVPVVVTSELDGAPLSGAIIETRALGSENLVEATTDEQGVAVLPCSTAQAYGVVLEGYAPRRLVAQGDEEELRAVLRPLTKFHGRVPTGAEIARLAAPRPIGWGGASLDLLLSGDEAQASRSSPKPGPGGTISLDSVVSSFNSGIYRVHGNTTVDMPDNLWRTSGHEAVVKPDGTWSLEVAIPDELEEWTDIHVTQRSSEYAERAIATIPRARPGQTIEVRDPWLTAPPLVLRFEPAFAHTGFLVELRDARSKDASASPAVIGRVSSGGRVIFANLPTGNWAYRLKSPGLLARWEPAGTFHHPGSAEPVVVQHGGHPLTVRLPLDEATERIHFQIAIVEAGGEPESLQTLLGGQSYTFPVIPEGVAAQVVLFGPGKTGNEKLVVGGITYGLQELRRVPLQPGQLEVVVHP